ncbi:hypothetical protein QAD02_013259 [Eretmocerus hayati]|uniref:Uncharacterized protein n=1 Tax=Eretmocerus hayati TaxID=131215 RepID=A0ACC2P4V6_9HYME|nr:hypothetical protein QAD02_013259 [Eretmocerus hayati]
MAWRIAVNFIPSYVCTDMSRALLNAVSLAFNEVSFFHYKETCMRLLLGELVYIKPDCQIVIDATHFIKALKGWKCWEGSPPGQKNFLVQCVALLVDAHELILFDKILECISIIAYSTRTGHRYCESFKYLKQRLIKRDFDEEIARLKPPNPVVDTFNYSETDLIHKHIHQIVDRSKRGIVYAEHDQANDYCNEKFAEQLTDLCMDMVCWTDLMNEHFGNKHQANHTSNSENYFGYLKANIKESSSAQRVDRVFAQECHLIDGIMNISAAEVQDGIEVRKIGRRKTTSLQQEQGLGSEHLREKEIWRDKVDIGEPDMGEDLESNMSKCLEIRTAEDGQASPSRPQRSGIHLRKQPQIELDLQRPRGRKKTKTFLWNECHSLPRKMKINPDEPCILINFDRSDALDSITELLSHSYCNYQNFQKVVASWANRAGTCGAHASFVQKYSISGATGPIYTLRGSLMRSLFSNGTEKSILDQGGKLIHLVSCGCNIDELFDQLMSENCGPTAKSDCANCQKKTLLNMPTTAISPSCLENNTVQANLEYIFNTDIEDTCPCSANIVMKYRLGPYLCLHFARDVNDSTMISIVENLSAVPKELIISNDRYRLSGLVSYKLVKDKEPARDPSHRSPIDTSLFQGHYIAYCLRIDGSWVVRDDMEKKLKQVKNPSNEGINISLVLYVKVSQLREPVSRYDEPMAEHQCNVISLPSNEGRLDTSAPAARTESNRMTALSRCFNAPAVTPDDSCRDLRALQIQEKVNEFLRNLEDGEPYNSDPEVSTYEDQIMNDSDSESSPCGSAETSEWEGEPRKKCLGDADDIVERVNDLNDGSHNVDDDFGIDENIDTDTSTDDSVRAVDKGMALIADGNDLNPSTDFSECGESIKLRNTCPVDSLLEIFAYAYRTRNQARELVRTFRQKYRGNCKFFDMIFNYNRKKRRAVYYQDIYQFALLQKYQMTSDGHTTTINCAYFIDNLFKSVMNDYCCIQISFECSRCHRKEKVQKKFESLEPGITAEAEGSLRNLQNDLNAIYSSTKPCKKCNQIGKVTYQFARYYCIDLWVNYGQDEVFKTKLMDIPAHLVLGGREYFLIGIVAFDAQNTDNSNDIMHYYSYVKLMNGRWQRRNNLPQYIEEVNRRNDEGLKPALISYIRRSMSKDRDKL